MGDRYQETGDPTDSHQQPLVDLETTPGTSTVGFLADPFQFLVSLTSPIILDPEDCVSHVGVDSDEPFEFGDIHQRGQEIYMDLCSSSCIRRNGFDILVLLAMIVAVGSVVTVTTKIRPSHDSSRVLVDGEEGQESNHTHRTVLYDALSSKISPVQYSKIR